MKKKIFINRQHVLRAQSGERVPCITYEMNGKQNECFGLELYFLNMKVATIIHRPGPSPQVFIETDKLILKPL